MSWSPSADYWARKIKAIETAIDATLRDLAELTVNGADERTLHAHVAQVNSYRKSLSKAEQDYRTWRNKRQNIERGARY